MQNLQIVQCPDGKLLQVMTGNFPAPINSAEQKLVMLPDGQMKLITMSINNVDCNLPLTTTTTMLTLDGKNLFHILPPGTNVLQIPGPLQLMPQAAVAATTSQTPTMNAMTSTPSFQSPHLLTTSSAVQTTVTASNFRHTVNSVPQKLWVKQQRVLSNGKSETITVPLRKPSLRTVFAPNAVTLLTLSKTALARPISQENHINGIKPYRKIYIKTEQLEKQRLSDCEEVLMGIVSKIVFDENTDPWQKMQERVSEENKVLQQKKVAEENKVLQQKMQEKVAEEVLQQKMREQVAKENKVLQRKMREKVAEENKILELKMREKFLEEKRVLRQKMRAKVYEEKKLLRQKMREKVFEERLLQSIANKRFAALFKHSEKVRKEIIQKKLLMEKYLYMEIQKEICMEVAEMEKEAAALKKFKIQNSVVRIRKLDVAKALAQVDRERRCSAKPAKNVDVAASDAVRKMRCTFMREKLITSQQLQKRKKNNTVSNENVHVDVPITQVPTSDQTRVCKTQHTELERPVLSQQVQNKTTLSNDNESVLGLPWDVEAEIGNGNPHKILVTTVNMHGCEIREKLDILKH